MECLSNNSKHATVFEHKKHIVRIPLVSARKCHSIEIMVQSFFVLAKKTVCCILITRFMNSKFIKLIQCENYCQCQWWWLHWWWMCERVGHQAEIHSANKQVIIIVLLIRLEIYWLCSFWWNSMEKWLLLSRHAIECACTNENGQTATIFLSRIFAFWNCWNILR